MKKLKLEYSVEIDNLIDVMAEKMGLSYNEVEKMSFKEGIFPEGKKTFLTTQFGPDQHERQLRNAIYELMVNHNIQSMYVTYPI
jgi:hypothetical protein